MDMDTAEIKQRQEEATNQVNAILQRLERSYPGVSEGLATSLGSGVGAAGSLAALYGLGYTGVSAAGMTSGLATAGALVGGGMLSGVFVLAAPVAILATAGYGISKKRKNAKMSVALGTAIKELYEIQERLMQNAEYFREELALIKASVEILSAKKPK